MRKCTSVYCGIHFRGLCTHFASISGSDAGQAPRREELWIVQSNEQIDTVQLAGQREFAARTLEREAKNLAQIDAALKHIDNGEFGICLDCEEAIAPKRLAALPWARFCLHCQELHGARKAMDTDEPRLAA